MKNNILLSDDEKSALRALKRLAKKWPYTLWVFAADAKLYIMKKTQGHLEHAMNDTQGVDQDYIIDSIDIEADGGDW